MALLLDSMSDEQRDRYEVVRRSKLLPSEMKRYLQSIGVTPPGKQLLIMLGSVAKVCFPATWRVLCVWRRPDCVDSIAVKIVV